MKFKRFSKLQRRTKVKIFTAALLSGVTVSTAVSFSYTYNNLVKGKSDQSTSTYLRSGQMNSDVYGSQYSAYHMKTLNVVNTIWQANLISTNSTHIFAPTDQGLAFINRKSGEPEFYAANSRPGESNHEKLTKYLIQTYYNPSCNLFAALFTDSTYNQVNFNLFSAVDGTQLYSAQLVSNLGSKDPKFAGKAKYFAFSPLFCEPGGRTHASWNVFPRFIVDNKAINDRSTSVAWNIQVAPNSDGTLWSWQTQINNSTYYSSWDGIGLIWTGIISAYGGESSNKNSFFYVSQQKQNGDGLTRLVFFPQYCNSYNTFSEIYTVSDYKYIDLPTNLSFINNPDEANDLVLKSSPIPNAQWSVNWGYRSSDGIKSIKIRQPLFMADGSIHSFVFETKKNGPQDIWDIGEMYAPGEIGEFSIESLTPSLWAWDKYTEGGAHGNVPGFSTFVHNDNSIDVREASEGQAGGFLDDSNHATVHTYNQLKNVQLDKNPAILSSSRSSSSIEPRSNPDNIPSIISVQTTSNGSDRGDPTTSKASQWKSYTDFMSNHPTLPAQGYPPSNGIAYWMYDNNSIFFPRGLRYYNNVWIDELTPNDADGSILLKYRYSPEATQNDTTNLTPQITVKLAGFKAPTNVVSGSVNLSSVSINDVTQTQFKNALISSYRILAPRSGIINASDITLSNIKISPYSNTITCDITLPANKVSLSDGSQSSSSVVYRNIRISGFKPNERMVIGSADGYDVYGFQKDTNYLWAIDTTANSGAGDWAYLIGTRWILTSSEAIDITRLKGYSKVQGRTLNNINDDDLRTLVYDNITNYWGCAPDGVTANDIRLVRGSTNAAAGTVTVNVYLKKIINSTGEEEDVSSNTSSQIGGTINFKNFLRQPPTDWKSGCENIDISSSDFANTALAQLPAYFLDGKVDIIKNFILEKQNYFFSNLLPSGINQNDIIITKESIKSNNAAGTLTFSFSINKGYTSTGQSGTISLATRTITVSHMKKIDNTVVTENSSSTVDKSQVYPSTLTQDQMKALVSVNQQKNIVWRNGQMLAANNLTDLTGTGKDYAGNFYDNTSTTPITLSVGTNITQSNSSYYGYSSRFTPNIDIYQIIGDKNEMQVRLSASDDYRGTASIEVTIPHANVDGTIKQIVTTVSLTGLKCKNTLAVGGPIDVPDKIAYQVTDDELADQIIKKGYIQNGPDVTKEDILIKNRKNDNTTGTINCTVYVQHNKAWSEGKKVDSTYWSDINYTVTKTIPATTYKDQRRVNGAAKFGTQYADSSVTDAEIKKYIIENNTQFFNNMLPGTTESDIDIDGSLIPDISTGEVKFRLKLYKYVDPSTGELIFPATPGEVVKPLLSNGEFTIYGFNTGGLTTQVDGGDLGIHDKIPSKVTNTELAHKIFELNLVKDIADGKVLKEDDIFIENRTGNNNDVAGTIKCTVKILNSKAWTNGQPDVVKTFNDVVYTGFARVNATTFNATTTVPGQDTFNTIPADEVKEPQIKDFISKNMEKFIVDPAPETTINNIEIFDTTDYRNTGEFKFRIRLNRYYDQATGQLIQVNFSDPKVKESPLFTITGFRIQDPTNVGALNNIEITMPSGTDNWVNNASNLELAKTTILNSIKANSTLFIPPSADITVTLDPSTTEQETAAGIVKFNVVLNQKYDDTGTLQTVNTNFVAVTNGWRKLNTTILTTSSSQFVYEVGGSQDFALDDVTDEQIYTYVLGLLNNQKIITGDLHNISFGSFTMDNLTNRKPVVRDLVNNLATIRFDIAAGTIYNNGVLVNTATPITFKIEFKTPKETTIKQSGNFTYDEIYGTTPLENRLILDDPTITADKEAYFINKVVEKQNVIFNSIPSAGIKNANLSIKPNTLKLDVFHGVASFTVILNNSVPTPNAEFAITISGYKTKETTIKKYVFNNGEPDQIVTIATKEWIFNRITEGGDKSYLYTSMFNNIPADFNQLTQVVIGQPIYHKDSVEFDLTLNGVYTDTGTWGPKRITFTGFQSSFIDTEFPGGSVELDGEPFNQYASDITVDNINLKNRIIENKLIIAPTPGKNLTVNDIVFDRVYDQNDIDGKLTLDLKIINDRAQTSAAPVKEKIFTGVTLTGFKTRPVSSWALNKTVSDPTEFSEIYAKDYTIPQIQKYVFDHQDKFFVSIPTITLEDVVITNPKVVSPGVLGFTIGLKQYYNSTTGLITRDDGDVFTNSDFKLSGFDTRDTQLANSGNFTYQQLWEGSGTPPTLDETTIITKQYFREAIARNANKIFTQAPTSIVQDDIAVKGFDPQVWDGTVTVNFDLLNARPSSKPFTIKIQGFTAKPTQIKNNKDSFELGDINIPAVAANSNWIIDKLVQEQAVVFENLPSTPSFDLRKEITLIGDPVANAPGKPNGSVTFTVRVNHVYTELGYLEKQLTFTGFKTIGLTTTIDPSIKRLDGVSDIFASDVKPNNDSPESIAIIDRLKKSIKDSNLIIGFNTNVDLKPNDINIIEVRNPNDLTGELTMKLSVVNNKGWVEGHNQETVDLKEVTLSGFNTRHPTVVKDGITIEDKKAFGSLWVNQFENKDLVRYILAHPTDFFENAPPLTADDIYINKWIPEPTSGAISVSIGLNKIYNSTDGTLTSVDGLTNMRQFTIQGFLINQSGSTEIDPNVQEKGIVAGEVLFNTIFPGDKGFLIDWYTSASYKQKQDRIVEYINNAITDPSVPNLILKNPSLNGYNTRATSAIIHPLTSPKPAIRKVTVTINFENWIENGIGVPATKTLDIWLRDTPSPEIFEKPIKDVLSTSLPSLNNLSQADKEQKIKEIICEQLNQQLDNVPDTFIPVHQNGRLFEPKDLNSTVIIFNSDDSVTIKRIVIGDPAAGGILIRQMTIVPMNFTSSNWMMYAVIGGLGTILALAVLVLGYVVIKFAQKKKEPAEDGW